MGHNGLVRRSFAGLLFGVAFAFACLAISGFLLHRTAFSPDRVADQAESIMQDEEVQREVIEALSDGTADAMYPGDPTGAARVRDNIAVVASTPAGAPLFGSLLTGVQAVLIGDAAGPVVVSPEQLIQITRDERAGALQPLEVVVPTLGTLDVIDGILGWLVPVSGIAAIIFFVLCFLARPERAALFRTLGIGLIALAALAIVFSYVLPKFIPPLLDESAWARTPALMADAGLGLTLFAAFVLAGAGAALFAASTRMGRSRRWSTPVSTYRYREERSWS